MQKSIDEYTFEEFHDEWGLNETDNERIFWVNEHPDHRALNAAETVADEFPHLTVVGFHSRMAMSDVSYNIHPSGEWVFLSFYPIRADKWTPQIVGDIRDGLAEINGEDPEPEVDEPE